MGDYETPHSAALQWECDHECNAIQQFMAVTGVNVGVFLSIDYPSLATSPDSIILLDNEKFGIVEVDIEVKSPYKHCDNSIETACQDQALCLSILVY